MNTDARMTYVKVGHATISIDYEAEAFSVVLDAAPSVRTEDLGDGVLIDRDTRDGRIVAVEVIASPVAAARSVTQENA